MSFGRYLRTLENGSSADPVNAAATRIVLR